MVVQYDESVPINFNLVKEYFTDALASEGLLTLEQAEMIKRSYAITLVRRNWFGRLIDSLIWSKESKDEYKVVVVKVVVPQRNAAPQQAPQQTSQQ